MDGTGPVRPVPGVHASPAPRNTETPTNTLPREQTVTATQGTTETGIGTRQPAGQGVHANGERKQGRQDEPRDKVRRQIEIDPETRDVLLKVVDQNTGMVRWQIPAETMMNMRIYAERMAQENAREEATLNRPALRPVEKAV
ncbi:MAG: hypothetical protein H6878_11385 [Rhodobiaceae bacterium]|nr:hypothetical protein [Rhodobiaceae bacterium]